MCKKSNNQSNTCPHCNQALDSIITCQSVVFCGCCQNSLLINPFLKSLERLSFWQFIGYFIKSQYKLYLACGIICGFFVAIITIFDNLDKINVSQTFGISLIIIALIIIGVGIYYTEKKLQNYPADKLKNKLIIKGIDTYTLIQNDFKISFALEKLAEQFDKFTACCPHCGSQRLHQRLDTFVCKNCHCCFGLNKKLTHLKTINLAIQYIFIFTLIRYLDNVVYAMPLFLIVLFFVNLIAQYYWFKTSKWYIHAS